MGSQKAFPFVSICEYRHECIRNLTEKKLICLILTQQLMLQNITEQQIEEYRQAFALFDKDGDGSINNKQLKTVLRSLGHNPSKAQLDILIALVDEDKSGSIDFREFLLMMSRKINEKTIIDELIDVFKIFDKDDDGYISKFELKHLMRVVGNQKVNQNTDRMLQQCDDNGTESVSLTRFVYHMLSEANHQN